MLSLRHTMYTDGLSLSATASHTITALSRPHTQKADPEHTDTFERKRAAGVTSRPSSATATDDAAKSHKASKKKYDSELHRLVADNDLARIGALLQANPAAIRGADDEGDTPLHVAARESSPSTVQLLLDHGASLYANNAYGFTPLYEASLQDREGIAQLLAQHMLDQPDLTEPAWVTIDDLRQRLRAWEKEHPNHGQPHSNATIADAVCMLTSTDLESRINNPEALIKYAAHLASVDGTIDGVEANGWNSNAFLLQRIRALLTVVLNGPKSSDPALCAFTAADREKLLGEIANELESLRAIRRIETIFDVPESRKRSVAQVEANNTVARALSQPIHTEICVPTGHEGHAIYVSLRKTIVQPSPEWPHVRAPTPVLQVRIDNLGDGTSANHGHAPMGKRTSRTISIPLDLAGTPDIRRMLSDMLRDMIVCDSTPKTDSEQFYSIVARFVQNLRRGQPHNVLDNAGMQSPDGQSKQWTGNCVLKNHCPGLRVRLDDNTLYRRFNDYEEILAEALLHDYADPVALLQKAKRAKAKEKFEHLLKETSSDRDARLRHFLDKPKHADLARHIDAEQLKRLIRDGHDTTLDTLLSHGLDANITDNQQQTPLFWAVAHNQVATVRTLLDHGASAHATDDAGETALFEAARSGHPEMISTLVQHGANMRQPNHAGETPQQLLQAWFAHVEALQGTLGTEMGATKRKRAPATPRNGRAAASQFAVTA